MVSRSRGQSSMAAQRIAFSTISGFYNVQKNASGTNYPWLTQYGWDSFIAGIPHPTAIVFAFGSQWLDAKAPNTTITNYSQKLTMRVSRSGTRKKAAKTNAIGAAWT